MPDVQTGTHRDDLGKLVAQFLLDPSKMTIATRCCPLVSVSARGGSFEIPDHDNYAGAGGTSIKRGPGDEHKPLSFTKTEVVWSTEGAGVTDSIAREDVETLTPEEREIVEQEVIQPLARAILLDMEGECEDAFTATTNAEAVGTKWDNAGVTLALTLGDWDGAYNTFLTNTSETEVPNAVIMGRDVMQALRRGPLATAASLSNSKLSDIAAANLFSEWLALELGVEPAKIWIGHNSAWAGKCFLFRTEGGGIRSSFRGIKSAIAIPFVMREGDVVEVVEEYKPSTRSWHYYVNAEWGMCSANPDYLVEFTSPLT